MTRVGRSSQPSSKRQKTMEIETVEDASQEMEPLAPAEWTEPLLSQHENRIQPELFTNKLNKKKPFVQDKAVKKEDFEGFGVIECFDRLGWGRFLDLEVSGVYKEEVIEWMSTLKKTGKTAQDVKLSGKVGGKFAILDLAFIRRTFTIDTGIVGKSKVQYKYPTEQELSESKANEEEWNHRLETVFRVPKEGMLANNLKPLVRVLWRIGLWNVHPRFSDPERVRRYEVSIIYALMTGEIPISYGHLVLSNIWKAHELQEKKHIPHPFIISELLRTKKVIPKGKEPTPIWLNHRCITRNSFQAIGFMETASGVRYLCRQRFQKPEDMEQMPSTEPNQGVEIMSITLPQQEHGESQLVLQIQSDPSNQQNEIPSIHHESTTFVSHEETHPPHGHNETASDREESYLLKKILDEIGKLNERVGRLEAQRKNDHEEIMKKFEALQQKPS